MPPLQFIEHLERANIPYTQLALPPELNSSFGQRDFQEGTLLEGKADVPMPLV